ncbi:MAG: hypothetical protein HUU49_04840 [Candidatus Buchananbacteria bacterium]|nr:hypothetical protein [Candidatus Buchananbacteria bacterium]
MKFTFLQKNFLVVSLLILTTFLMTTHFVAASTMDQVNSGFAQTGEEAGFPTQGGKPKVEFSQAFINYVNSMIGLMGLLFMVLVIYGGWLWMSARGSEEQVTKAKKLIINAVIGLAAVIGARLVVELVIIYLSRTFVS